MDGWHSSAHAGVSPETTATAAAVRDHIWSNQRPYAEAAPAADSSDFLVSDSILVDEELLRHFRHAILLVLFLTVSIELTVV